MTFPKFGGLTEKEIPLISPSKGDECIHCSGKGRHKNGHSYFHGNLYLECQWCGGTGSQKECHKRMEKFKRNSVNKNVKN